MLGEFPHQDLHQLAQKHGPIMHLRLGIVRDILDILAQCNRPKPNSTLRASQVSYLY